MFFFFFKQKTAYDMHISDWSSDVCSSDLIGAGPVERIACVMRRVRIRGLRVCGGPAAANATTAIRRMTGCVFMASGLFSKNACAETIFDGKASIRAPTNEGTGENERRPAVARQRFCALPVFTPRPSPRSEEHTSELQSLMRISYAVFCFKK